MVQGTIGGSGLTSYTLSDGAITFTPKLAIFMYSHNAALATSDNSSLASFGVADGTNQWAETYLIANGASNTQAPHTKRNDACVLGVTHTSGLIEKYEFTEFVTGGVTVTATVGGGTARYCTVLLLGGGISTSVGQATMGSSGVAATVSPSFETNILITCFGLLNQTPTDNNARFNLGFGAYDGTTHMQCGFDFYATDSGAGTGGLGSLDPNIGVSSTKIDIDGINGNSGDITFGNVTSTSFDLTATGTRATGNVNYCAINLPDQTKAWVGMVDTPTSTGTWDFTSPGFEPLAMLFGMTTSTAVGQYNITNGEDIVGGHGVALIASNDTGSHSLVNGRTGSNSDTSRWTDADIMLRDSEDAADVDMTLTDFDADGANFSLATANGTARKWMAMAIG